MGQNPIFFKKLDLKASLRRRLPTIFLPLLDDGGSESDDPASDHPDVTVQERELLSRGKWN